MVFEKPWDGVGCRHQDGSFVEGGGNEKEKLAKVINSSNGQECIHRKRCQDC